MYKLTLGGSLKMRIKAKKFIVTTITLLSLFSCSRIESLQTLKGISNDIPKTVPQNQSYSPNFMLHNFSSEGASLEASSHRAPAKQLSIGSEGFTKAVSASFKLRGGAYVH